MQTYQSKRTPELYVEWREDDGLAPRFEARASVKHTARKNQQLSKQAHRALSLFLDGECRHPDLLGVEVRSVEYESAKQQLFAGVGSSGNNTNGDAVLAALKHSQAVLRSVLATSLHRKKTPTLSFYYTGDSNTGGEPCRLKP